MRGLSLLLHLVATLQLAVAALAPTRPFLPYVPDGPAAADAREWLRQHHSASPQLHGEWSDCSTYQWQLRGAEAVCARRRPAEAAAKRQRFLVIAPVGDDFDPSARRNRWLSNPAAADFDLTVVYFGNRQNFTCFGCKHVWHLKGSKWRLIYLAMTSPEWKDITAAANYSHVLLPDDDLIMDTCSLMATYHLIQTNDLLMAQMSICRAEHTQHVFWSHLFQQEGSLLRFTAFNEVMAPFVSFSFFDTVVRRSLAFAHSGWGLDSLWPYLLGYPRDRIAVIDAVCMTHSGSAGEPNNRTGPTVYAAALNETHLRADEEETALYNEWHLWAENLTELGIPVLTRARGQLVFSQVPLPPGCPAWHEVPGGRCWSDDLRPAPTRQAAGWARTLRRDGSSRLAAATLLAAVVLAAATCTVGRAAALRWRAASCVQRLSQGARHDKLGV